MPTPTFDPSWHDMSDYAVHFTKAYKGRSAYDNMLGILSGGSLRARNAFGIARRKAPRGTQHAVCFSEIPMHLASRLAKRRGPYGIGFTKEFLLKRGGAPVWYAERGSVAALAVDALVADGLASGNPAAPIWTVTPFIDSPGLYGSSSYRFEWEREWRHIGDLRFAVSDPAFLVIPESLHSSARGFFEEARDEHLGPCYECPFLDPGWDRARVRAALSTP